MKKILALILVMVLVLATVVGCSSKQNAAPDSGGYGADGGSYGAPYYAGEDIAPPSAGLYSTNDSAVLYEMEGGADADVEAPLADPEGNGNATDDGHKIIHTSSLSIETLDYDASYAAILSQLKQCGGYISYSDQYGGGTQGGYTRARYADFEFRIPVANYEEFLAAADGFGTVTHRSDTTQDVTANYMDIEARVLSLETQEERLLALLAEAKDLEVLLMLEDKLAAVRYEIESYTSTLNRYDDLVAYCTVGLSLTEVATITPVRTKTFWQEAWETVLDSLRSVGAFLKTVLFGVIYVLPYLLLLLIPVLIILLIVRGNRRKKAKKQLPPQDTLPAERPDPQKEK